MLIGGRRRLCGSAMRLDAPSRVAQMEKGDSTGAQLCNRRTGGDATAAVHLCPSSAEIQFAASSTTHCRRPFGRRAEPPSRIHSRHPSRPDQTFQMPSKPHNDPQSRSTDRTGGSRYFWKDNNTNQHFFILKTSFQKKKCRWPSSVYPPKLSFFPFKQIFYCQRRGRRASAANMMFSTGFRLLFCNIWWLQFY